MDQTSTDPDFGFSGGRAEQWHNRAHAHPPKKRVEKYWIFIQYNQASLAQHRTSHSYEGVINMRTNLAYLSPAANDLPIRRKADVQSLWRKRGWMPPSEYRNDFSQSCRPPILAGMKTLELVKWR